MAVKKLTLVFYINLCCNVSQLAPHPLISTYIQSSENNEKNHRQGKTLGLLTVGANALSPVVSTAGQVALGTIAAISAIKPLILLGIGKCK